MLMGVNYKCANDLNRNIEVELHPDFCWAEHLIDSECRDVQMNQWYQLYFPFKIDFIEVSDDGEGLVVRECTREGIQLEKLESYFQSNTLNKFKRIIFDASTVKFLDRIAPSFIAYLYYYFLEVNGELYFNFRSFTTLTGFEINQCAEISKMNEVHRIVSSLTPADERFGKKFIIRKFKGIIDKGGKFSHVFDVNQSIINDNNIAYFKKLQGSRVEQFPSSEREEDTDDGEKKIFHQETYPIKITNHSIGYYLKITKNKQTEIDIEVLLSIYNDQIRDSGFHLMQLVLMQSFEDSYKLNCVFV